MVKFPTLTVSNPEIFAKSLSIIVAASVICNVSVPLPNEYLSALVRLPLSVLIVSAPPSNEILSLLEPVTTVTLPALAPVILISPSAPLISIVAFTPESITTSLIPASTAASPSTTLYIPDVLDNFKISMPVLPENIASVIFVVVVVISKVSPKISAPAAIVSVEVKFSPETFMMSSPAPVEILSTPLPMVIISEPPAVVTTISLITPDKSTVTLLTPSKPLALIVLNPELFALVAKTEAVPSVIV